jgi:hypothetical protein
MSGWVIFGRLSLRELQWLCQRVVSVELLELRFVALIGDQNSPAEPIQSLGLIFCFFGTAAQCLARNHMSRGRLCFVVSIWMARCVRFLRRAHAVPSMITQHRGHASRHNSQHLCVLPKIERSIMSYSRRSDCRYQCHRSTPARVNVACLPSRYMIKRPHAIMVLHLIHNTEAL